MTIPRDGHRTNEPPRSGGTGRTARGFRLLGGVGPLEARPGAGDPAILAASASLLVAAEAGTREARRGACAALEHELAAHVARQAEAMRRSSYPLAAGHQAAHDRLLSELGPLLRQVEGGAAPHQSRRRAAEEIVIRLIAHVAAYDTGLVDYLEGPGDG